MLSHKIFRDDPYDWTTDAGVVPLSVDACSAVIQPCCAVKCRKNTCFWLQSCHLIPDACSPLARTVLCQIPFAKVSEWFWWIFYNILFEWKGKYCKQQIFISKSAHAVTVRAMAGRVTRPRAVAVEGLQMEPM